MATCEVSESLCRRVADSVLAILALIPEENMRAPVFLLSASRQNLGRLLLIRILVLAAQAGSVGFAWLSDLLPLPRLALGLTLGLSACLILFTALRLRAPPVTDQEYAVQLACDLIIHSTLLYYSGGSTNPFVSYYLVPLTIAAATLPWIYSMVLSGLALTGYTLLLIWYHPLHLQAVQHEAMLINLHLFGMWLNFALSAAFITFFVVKMSEALRWQAHMQAERREESMRDQQLLAVATQAAGAAHELGTPLATMSVLLNEPAPGAPAGPDPAGRPGIAPGTGQAVQAHPPATGTGGRGRPSSGDRGAKRRGMAGIGAAPLAPDASGGFLPLPVPGPRLRAAPDPADRPQPGSAEPAEQCGGRLSRRPRHPPGLGQQQYLPEYPRPRRRGAWRSPNRSANRSSPPRARASASACFSVRPA